jgi:hypothetical protein
MKVFVATSEGQRWRKNDFCWTNEGEFVRFGSECTGEAVDGACGCRRCLIGFDSEVGTTTFKVSDVGIEKTEYMRLLSESLDRSGYKSQGYAMLMGRKLLKRAQRYPEGAVLERRGRVIRVRS